MTESDIVAVLLTHKIAESLHKTFVWTKKENIQRLNFAGGTCRDDFLPYLMCGIIRRTHGFFVPIARKRVNQQNGLGLTVRAEDIIQPIIQCLLNHFPRSGWHNDDVGANLQLCSNLNTDNWAKLSICFLQFKTEY